jgi:hypothetical protein
VSRVQDSDKSVDQRLSCDTRVGSANDATRTVTTFAFPRFGVFLSIFQHSFPGISTTFLIYSGYKTPIQNMDELFASGIKLAYHQKQNYVFDNGDETEEFKVQRYRANCPSFMFVWTGENTSRICQY